MNVITSLNRQLNERAPRGALRFCRKFHLRWRASCDSGGRREERSSALNKRRSKAVNRMYEPLIPGVNTPGALQPIAANAPPPPQLPPPQLASQPPPPQPQPPPAFARPVSRELVERRRGARAFSRRRNRRRRLHRRRRRAAPSARSSDSIRTTRSSPP